MAKFQTVEDVKKAFLMRSGGSDVLENHRGFRYSDIDKLAPVVEELLKTDYNTHVGYGFSEVMEAISHFQQAFGTRTYINDFNAGGNSDKVSESLYRDVDLSACEDNFFSTCESFEGTTAQQAPYPVPSLSFVMYRYEKSVLPFLTHLFDLRGNRGLIYFQKITSVDGMGSIAAKDELGNPRQYVKQPDAYATTKINNEKLGTLATGDDDFEATLKFKPQPGSLIVNIDGEEGWFQDIQEAQAHKANKAILTSINGNLGYATFDYETLKLNITLANAATAEANVRASYNREVELKEAGEDATRRIPRFTMSVEAEQVITENVSIQTETNIYQEALARAIFGLDWNAEVDKAMGMIYNKEMANKVLREINEVIPAKNLIQHDITATLNTTGTGDNKLFNVQFMAVIFSVLRKKINQASGIPVKKFTTLVININLLPIFEALPKFTVATANDEDQMGGMFLAGTYDGIPVVCAYDDILGEGECIALYKGQSQEFLTPHVLGIFMDPVVRDVFDQNNLAINRKQLMSTIGTKCIAQNLAAKLTVEGVDDLLGIIEQKYGD
jgi:hypothetical protein